MLLLPHNNDVAKPRALSTFLDELAELGFDKGLIKNQNLEKGYRNAEDTPDNDSHNEESSSDIENQKEHVKEEEEDEVVCENGSEAESTQESETTMKTTVRTQKEVALKSPPPFSLKIRVNIVRTLMCTGH